MTETASSNGSHSLGAVFWPLVLLAAGGGVLRAAGLPCPAVPFVKQCVVGDGTVRIEAVRVEAGPGELAREVGALRAGLGERGVPVRDDGFPVRLEVAAVEFPPIRSVYRPSIERQGYSLQVGPAGVVVRALAPQGVFYGVQTLLQLLDAGRTLPVVNILDWPDLAERMVSVDAARQNENATYYRRLIEFLARYKISRLHWHLTDDENYTNVAAFASVARELDPRGLDTTIWTPTRYMSDALWPGIAYAAAQSWSGSNYHDDDFYAGFAREFFGSPDGRAFGRAWRDACQMRWWLDEFYPACWIDEQSLDEACRLVDLRAEDIRTLLARLTRVEAELRKLTAGVCRNEVAWMAIIRSVATRAYTMRRLLAAPEVRSAGRWNVALVRELDAGCVQALGWIEEDWDRNRWPDDPNKDGAYMNVQNLLYRFRQMHAFHQHILAGSGGTPMR